MARPPAVSASARTSRALERYALLIRSATTRRKSSRNHRRRCRCRRPSATILPGRTCYTARRTCRACRLQDITEDAAHRRRPRCPQDVGPPAGRRKRTARRKAPREDRTDPPAVARRHLPAGDRTSRGRSDRPADQEARPQDRPQEARRPSPPADHQASRPADHAAGDHHGRQPDRARLQPARKTRPRPRLPLM